MLRRAFLLALLGAAALRAQPPPADSLKKTLRQAHTLLEEVEERDPLEYSADEMLLAAEGDSILLRGHALMRHAGARLEAGEMVYRRRKRQIEARARRNDEGKLVGKPVLRRGDEVIEGARILYDLESGTGTVIEGRIAYDKGFYAGRQIQSHSEKEFHVREGSYTTCDLEHPHFDFYSPRIKVIAGEMVIARPVYFRIRGKPVFWIPFYVFSLREDRRQSGLLTPDFGRRALRFGARQSEWEVRNLGYYFAPGDLWDIALSGDLRQRSGWLTRLRFNYNKRYQFQGHLETQIENRQSGDLRQFEWRTNLEHRQELGADANLRISGDFQSTKNFNRDNSNSLQERLNRTLRSNFTFNKRWRQAGYSLTLNASQTRNLDTDRFDTVFPEVRLRGNRKALAGGGRRRRTGHPWYSQVFYEFSGRLRNIQRGSPADTTTSTDANATLRLSAQQKPLSWFNLNTGLNEEWRDPDLRRGKNRFEAVRRDRFNATANFTRTFYGLFHPQIGPLTTLRHVIKPSLDFSYQAAHSDTGGFGFGGRASPWRQNRRLDFRLDNTFWIKALRGEEERKVRLAQLNFSSGYDFDRKRRPLSDLLTRFTIDAGRRLDTRLTLSSEFYDDDDKFMLWPRLRQLEVNSTLRFAGRAAAAASGGGKALEAPTYGPPAARSRDPDFDAGGFGFENGLQRDIQRPQGRHSFLLSYYYARNRSFGRTNSRSWVRSSLGVNWHRWRLDYSINYNLKLPGTAFFSTDRVTAELLSLQRRFHDWTTTFNIEPTRFHRDFAFFFKFQFNDIPQIKFERGDSRRVRR